MLSATCSCAVCPATRELTTPWFGGAGTSLAHRPSPQSDRTVDERPAGRVAAAQGQAERVERRGAVVDGHGNERDRVPVVEPVPIAVILWVASLKTRERVWVDAKFTPAPGSARLTSGPPDLRAAER